MKISVWIMIACLILHTSNCYILLTANMEDVQSLAKQLASSPVVDQVTRIWRRAATQFQREINRDARRQGEESEEEKNTTPSVDPKRRTKNEVPRTAALTEGGKNSNGESENEDSQRTKRVVRDLIAIGRSSGILEPIKRAYDMLVNNA